MIAKRRLDWNAGPSADRHSAKLEGRPADARCFAVLPRHKSSWELSLDGRMLGRSSASASWHGFELVSPTSGQGTLEIAFERSHDRVTCDVYILTEVSPSEGFEKLSPGSFLPLEVNYSIAINDNTGEAVLTPVIQMLSFGPATLIASLKVDGHELLPSARLPLESGVSEVKLRPVRLMRPRRWWPKGKSPPSSPYRMELLLLQSEGGLVDVKELDVWSTQS